MTLLSIITIVSGKKLSSSVLLFPTKYYEIHNDISPIKKYINDYSKNKVLDLLIYGATKGIIGAKKEIIDCLKSTGNTVEIMNTDSACRTWTVLLGEGRSVCAYLEINYD